MDKINTAKEPQAQKQECLAKKENGHHQAYLTWVHQGDGFNYYKCISCGWIKPDFECTTIADWHIAEIEKAKQEGIKEYEQKRWNEIIKKGVNNG